ncbi:MAG: hypothetical protein NZ873_00685 [Crenarchaeota archaeon]|nr:hypothetical protein [Thermoproteota archaeon]MDW8033685.1 hypothetical protein [Nitrososphaerota archaeon]
MIRGLLRIVSFTIMLLVGFILKQLLDSLWLISTGFYSNGLSSLVALIIIVFSSTLLLPLKQESRKKINIVFKEIFVFLSIWVAASLFTAVLRQSRHTQIGFAVASLYILFRRLIFNRETWFRILFELEEYSDTPSGSTILMCVAPVPKIFVAKGFGLRSIMRVLKGEARIFTDNAGDIFVKSFKNIKAIELQGSLASFVKVVTENWSREVALFCEAKHTGRLFRFRVKLASDNVQALESFINGLSKLDDKEDLKWAIEKWLMLKPCVKPIKLVDNGVLLEPKMIPEKLFIAGDLEEVEEFAIQACLSQLRRYSRILIINGEDDSSFENRVKEKLEAEGFKAFTKGVKKFRDKNRSEVILIKETALDKKIIDDVSKKPIVALWLRDSSKNLELKVPFRVLTYNKPEIKGVLEADCLLLLNPDKNVLECFVPERYGLMLQGKTVMVSANEVRVLK